jgi:hypothetical protein
MNRMEKRIAGRDGPRPGVAACSLPSQTVTSGRTMLAGGSSLYQQRNQNRVQTQVQVQNQNVRQVNGLEILRNQGSRIDRIENKLEQLESMQVMHTSGVKRDIDLINSGYNETMSKMKEYIKSLELKIKQLTGIRGEKGEKGDPGVQGVQGVQGDKGERGVPYIKEPTNIENTVEKAVENIVETSNITLEIIES